MYLLYTNTWDIWPMASPQDSPEIVIGSRAGHKRSYLNRRRRSRRSRRRGCSHVLPSRHHRVEEGDRSGSRILEARSRSTSRGTRRPRAAASTTASTPPPGRPGHTGRAVVARVQQEASHAEAQGAEEALDGRSTGRAGPRRPRRWTRAAELGFSERRRRREATRNKSNWRRSESTARRSL